MKTVTDNLNSLLTNSGPGIVDCLLIELQAWKKLLHNLLILSWLRLCQLTWKNLLSVQYIMVMENHLLGHSNYHGLLYSRVHIKSILHFVPLIYPFAEEEMDYFQCRIRCWGSAFILENHSGKRTWVQDEKTSPPSLLNQHITWACEVFYKSLIQLNFHSKLIEVIRLTMEEDICY